MTQTSYDALHNKYMEVTKSVAEESMKQAAAEVIDQQDGIQDTMVSVDGTWQRRRYSSHNRVVSAISVTTGKALDLVMTSNYCKGCAQWNKQQLASQYRYLTWKATHVCSLNHNGSSELIEQKGAV